MIEHILKQNHNGRTTVLMKCPQCDAWGHLKRTNGKLLVCHDGKLHRVTGDLFERTRTIYNANRPWKI